MWDSKLNWRIIGCKVGVLGSLWSGDLVEFFRLKTLVFCGDPALRRAEASNIGTSTRTGIRSKNFVFVEN